jgi:hypothetical protein
MLKTKVLVSDIDNLTDARYFSAWMVDYLVFNIREGAKNKISVDQIVEIMQWVEGPEYGLEIDMELDRDYLFEVINKTGINLLISEYFSEAFILAFAECRCVTKKEGVSIKIDNDEFHFVNKVDQLASIENKNVFIKAEGEEQTGLKDFEFYDQLFELLEE